MRRQIGDALHDLDQAEQLTPEQTRTHRIARSPATSSSCWRGPATNSATCPSASEACRDAGLAGQSLS